MEARGLFIGGQWVESGDVVDVTSPFDDRTVGRVRQATPALIERAIESAHGARNVMKRLTLGERAAILTRVAALLVERREQIARTIEAEAGKPIRFARAEAERAADTFTESAVTARRLDGEMIPMDAYPPGAGRYGIVRRFPVGPISAISPFNFPLNLVSHKLGPAIAAGCPVVLKPASKTPLSALMLAEIVHAAGLPAGGLNVVPAARSAADALSEDPRLAMLTFTGSAEVGWRLKARAGAKKVVLELGGNAAAIVERDADVARAASRLAVGAFAYAGQSCISVQRIFVHRSVAPAFRAAFLAAVEREIGTGDPSRDETVCGPLIDSGNAQRVVDWADEAVRAGAERLTPARREGNVVWPVVLEGVDRRQKISCEEAFGPVAVLCEYDDFDAALEAINDSRFGLQAGIFTKDVGRLIRAFESLEVGGVVHDDFPTFRVDHMPYGGLKDSGLGREGPRYAVMEMTEPRLLVLDASASR